MATWGEFEADAPKLAARGRELMYRRGDGEGLLVTVRRDSSPRVHPVNAGVVNGHLYTFVQGKSSKRRDLDDDGRYALTTHFEPHAPHEFTVRGHARLIDDEQTRNAIAANWFFRVSPDYPPVRVTHRARFARRTTHRGRLAPEVHLVEHGPIMRAAKLILVATVVLIVWTVAVHGLADSQGWFVSDYQLGIDPGADQAALIGGLFRAGIVWFFGVLFLTIAAAVVQADRRR